jgi:hypothetical protein
MQSNVAHVVHILTDDPHEGIYCGFCLQNDPRYFMLLGRIKNGEEFTERYREAFVEFTEKTFLASGSLAQRLKLEAPRSEAMKTFWPGLAISGLGHGGVSVLRYGAMSNFMSGCALGSRVVNL